MCNSEVVLDSTKSYNCNYKTSKNDKKYLPTIRLLAYVESANTYHPNYRANK